MAQPVLYRAHPIKRLLDAIVVAPVDALVDQREHLPHQRVPQLQFPDPAVQRLHVTVIAVGVATPWPRRHPAVLRAAFLFLGGNAAMPPPRYVLPQWATAPTLSRAAGRLASAACRPIPVRSPSARFPGDDGAPHTPSVTGILRQPAFQSLPGRITEMFDHFGGRH